MKNIPNEADVKPFDTLPFLLDGKKIKKTLGRVLMNPITCIHHPCLNTLAYEMR